MSINRISTEFDQFYQNVLKDKSYIPEDELLQLKNKLRNNTYLIRTAKFMHLLNIRTLLINSPHGIGCAVLKCFKNKTQRVLRKIEGRLSPRQKY